MATDKPFKLIINYLPQAMTDEDFHALFAPCGEIQDSKIQRDRGTGYSHGYGFVQYTCAKDCEKAIQRLNGHKIGHKTLKVAYSKAKKGSRCCNLHVSGLTQNTTEANLKELFSKHAPVVSTRILREKDTKKSKEHGFVLCEDKEGADKAIAALNGYTDGTGLKLHVQYGEDSNEHRLNHPAFKDYIQQRSIEMAQAFSPYDPYQQGYYGYGPHNEMGYGDVYGAEGYAADGYSAVEYPEAGYEGASAGVDYWGAENVEQEYAGQEYAGQEYAGQEYAGQEYAGQEYAGQEYAGQEYAGQEYAGQEYAGQEYAGQEYAGQEYAGQEYAGQEYAGQEYAGQEYAGGEYPEVGPGNAGVGAIRGTARGRAARFNPMARPQPTRGVRPSRPARGAGPTRMPRPTHSINQGVSMAGPRAPQLPRPMRGAMPGRMPMSGPRPAGIPARGRMPRPVGPHRGQMPRPSMRGRAPGPRPLLMRGNRPPGIRAPQPNPHHIPPVRPFHAGNMAAAPHPEMMSGDPTMNVLFVANVGSVTDSDMYKLFSHHGRISKVDVIEKKGYAFVHMPVRAEAEAAISIVDGMIWKNGKTLQVKYKN